jgi:hypothetical protein
MQQTEVEMAVLCDSETTTLSTDWCLFQPCTVATDHGFDVDCRQAIAFPASAIADAMHSAWIFPQLHYTAPQQTGVMLVVQCLFTSKVATYFVENKKQPPC